MGFFVIADDGNKYGPADLATLNAWIAEGRLQPNTILEEVQTMERRPASTVPGLNFPGAPGPQAARTYAVPPVSHSVRNQSGLHSPGQVDMANATSRTSDEANSQMNKAWICAVLGFFCSCFVIPLFGLAAASKAESLGHRQAKVAMALNIVCLLVLAIIYYGIYRGTLAPGFR